MQRADVGARDERVVGRRGRPAGTVGIERHDRVEGRVEPVDPVEVGVQELDGRQLALPEQGRQLGRRAQAQIVVGHGHRLSVSFSTPAKADGWAGTRTRASETGSAAGGVHTCSPAVRSQRRRRSRDQARCRAGTAGGRHPSPRRRPPRHPRESPSGRPGLHGHSSHRLAKRLAAAGLHPAAKAEARSRQKPITPLARTPPRDPGRRRCTSSRGRSALSALHLPSQGSQDPTAGRAYGVAERDAGAVDVDPVEVGRAKLPPAGQANTCAANASFSSIRSMSQREAGLHRELSPWPGRDRSPCHRRYPGHGPGDQAEQRLQAELGRLLR